MDCGFAGDSDILGIGIRTGYYTQIFAVWFSNYFYFREAKVLRSVNNLFLLSLIIVGFDFFLNAHTTYIVHAFLLLQIGIVTGIVGITETARYATKYRETSRERLLLRMTIMTFGALFNVLFWWEGLNVMLPTPCGTYSFYFWKVRFDGWLRTVNKVQSLCAATCTAPNYVSRDAVTLVHDLRMRKARASFVEAVTAVENLSRPSCVSDRQAKKEQHIDTPEPQLSATSQSMSAKHTTVDKASNNVQSDSSSHSNSPEKRSESTAALKTACDRDRAILEDVAKAQKYLDLLMSIYPHPTASPNKKRITLRGCLTSRTRRPETQCSDPTPYWQCISGALRSFWTRRPPYSLQQGMSLHLIALGGIAPWKWPRILNRMYELDQSPATTTTTTPDWRHFTIASDLQLSRTGAPNSTAKWAFAATRQFVFVALLIAQVELTLVWNGVGGLQTLSSLGQLIPFILGVGGLIRVLWGKASLVWRGKTGVAGGGGAGGGGEGRAAGEYEMAMARYFELKGEEMDRPIRRAATV